MEWLKRVPVVGPAVGWVLRTRAYRVFEHFNDVGSNRMAGAVTFFGFLALFPLLTVALAVAAALLSDHRTDQLQQKIAEQFPGLSDQLNIHDIANNAGTVGVISGVILLVSGLGWVDTTRVCIRTSWALPIEPGNVIVRKLWDVGVLIGLGLVGAVSLGASTAAGAAANQVAKWIGAGHAGAGRAGLTAAAFVIAVAADLLVFSYLLTGLPRIFGQRRRVVLEAALMGAVGFELLKQALAAYVAGVATKSVYGAFGTPIALLLWINFMCRWLLYCVAWTATADPAAARARARARAREALAKADE
ncbi:YihY/virulence factor BrkB family protein [Streptacidiphilus rugosus]|uniref:YihY/virulence factor BrkB family protein n=1 Tax=Streptacidiphilus rugosus TaxID=405783 RepID=UPI00068CC36C|nr:YhjD/YihY/BrkB family envelope integrity protein [Streptacidiphilus rugosus]